MDSTEARQRLLESLISGGRDSGDDNNTINTNTRTVPAAYAQRQLWFIDQVQQQQTPYTLHTVQHLAFDVDPAMLERAINEIVARHEILRTRFELVNGTVVQQIDPLLAVRLGTLDVSDRPDEIQHAAVQQLVARSVGEPFDLSTGPLLRTEVVRLAENHSILFMAVHHIIFDWQSFQIFFSELDAIYGAMAGNQPHLLTENHEQYSAFALEQHRRLTDENIQKEIAFWQVELANVPMLDLPFDYSRPVTPSFRGDTLTLKLPASLLASLRQRGIDSQTTLFTVLLAGLCAGLGRVCGQSDFAIGLPMTGRDTESRQSAIGFFVDTLVTRASWTDDPSASELIKAAKTAIGRSFSHRTLPFELLVQHLQPVRDIGINPLFQVGFQLMQNAANQSSTGDTNPGGSGAMFDLCIDLWPQNDELQGRIQYSTDLFQRETVQMIAHMLVGSFEWLCQEHLRLSQWPLTSENHGGSVSELNGESVALPVSSCLDMISEVTLTTPDVPALIDSQHTFSYRELQERVNAIAHLLSGLNLSHESTVTLELYRSADLVCLQLALMHCGYPFACIDPCWPESRRQFIAEQLKPALVINDANREDFLNVPLGPHSELLPQANCAAYIIFTSGSSGPPKAVVIEHQALANVAISQRRLFNLGSGRRVAQLASPTFDASVFETVLALCSGATLVVAAAGILAANDLEQFLNRESIDAVVIPPSVLATIEPDACPGLRLVCVAGESCPIHLLARFGAGRDFWNLYGPTETTIWATFGKSAVGSKVAIGRPIANVQTRIADAHGQVVPVGMVGELYIAGAGLARGYLDNEVLTAERFVTGIQGRPGRFYRTGDLVRQTVSGEIVFLGRVDRQLKVRGLRIEPEEIEAVFREHEDVSEAVVVASGVETDLDLIAYIQSSSNNLVRLVNQCLELARKKLPAYMVPNRCVVVTELPRSPSGKVNQAALPAFDFHDEATQPVFVVPSTNTERQLAILIQQVLHVPKVGAQDEFFEIGGHSLAAATLVARSRKVFDVELSIGDVFRFTTVAGLAARLDELAKQQLDSEDDVQLVRLPRN